MSWWNHLVARAIYCSAYKMFGQHPESICHPQTTQYSRRQLTKDMTGRFNDNNYYYNIYDTVIDAGDVCILP